MEEIFCVYILYSDQHDKIYVGQTHDLINRIKSHNIFDTDSFTCKYRPWRVVHLEFFNSRKEALHREKLIKGGKGREWIKMNKEFFIRTGFISALGGRGFESPLRYTSPQFLRAFFMQKIFCVSNLQAQKKPIHIVSVFLFNGF
ncbi:MAG: GIY-YIG nuclease family protein, partial [Bacteroidia bacterium]|nr:GIY-YIG nuclease family protein [Bacteroidia bacterium]